MTDTEWNTTTTTTTANNSNSNNNNNNNINNYSGNSNNNDIFDGVSGVNRTCTRATPIAGATGNTKVKASQAKTRQTRHMDGLRKIINGMFVYVCVDSVCIMCVYVCI